MILNISFRTDIVSQYPEWLADTLLNKEYIGTRNPYNNKVLLFPTKDIEGIIFCSKDYSRFLPYIEEINKKYHCQYHYTITPYSRDIEPNVIKNWDYFIDLSNTVGKDKVIWRYDPILLYKQYTKEFHYQKFEQYCNHFNSYFKLCTFNFVNIYDKVKQNFPDLQPISKEDKEEIAKNLGEIALKYNVYLQTCIPGIEYPGIHNEGCITPKTLGLDIKPTKAPLLNGCMCTVHTYGIGNYNTCKNGCKYCYATSYVDPEPNYIDSCIPNGRINSTDIVSSISKRVVNQELNLFSYDLKRS